jgi:hypothetical protein
MSLDLTTLPFKEHRPILQWSWDCDPTPDILRDQIARTADAGFGGLCIEPMPNDFRPNDFPVRMKIPYLGDAFFDAIRLAVTLAGEHGLRIWLYDEGGWPSGQACGQVLKNHPHLEGQTLVHEAGRYIVEPTGLPDPFSLDATRRFMDLTHHRYEQAVGDHFGGVIEAMFSDELKVLGRVGTDRVPWTSDLPEQFAQRAGYDLTPLLGTLFEGHTAWRFPEKTIRQTRMDFARVWIALLVERCFAPQRDWCHRHGLLQTGHMAGEHDISRHAGLFGDFFAIMQTFDMPGVDSIWRQIWPGHRADFSLLAGSARALHSRRFAMSETGAVYGRDFHAGSLKWVTDHQIVRGINRFSLMKLPLCGDDEANISSLNTQGMAWDSYAVWNQHTAALAALTSTGELAPTVGVLYPSVDLAAHTGDGPGAAAQAIVEMLIALPGGCLWIDETAAIQGKLAGHQLTCGQAVFHTLVIAGGSFISQAFSSRLQQLQQAGVHIVVIGESPCRVLPETADHQAIIEPMQGLSQLRFEELAVDPALVLPAGHRPLYRVEQSARVASMLREHEGTKMLILHNESRDTPATLALDLPEAGRNFTMDTTIDLLGKLRPTDTLTLPPAQVMLITWADNVAAAPSIFTPGEPAKELNLTPWSITGVNDALGNPIEVTAAALASLRESPLAPWKDTLGETFSGQVVYQCTLTLDDLSRAPKLLDLGRVEHVARVHVNGKPAGLRAWSPYRFNLQGLLKPGQNQIELTIGNTMANAWWSPDSVARRKAKGQWNVYDQRIEQRCTPTLAGGLLGPIQWLDTSR